MRNILTKIGLAAGVIILFFAGSCNDINNLPLNMPLQIPFNKTGNAQQVLESQYYCLDSNQTYRDYRDKINKISFARASWRTISIKTNGISDTTGLVTGTMTVTLKSGTQTLFSFPINNIKPANYIKTPLTIALTQAQIQAVTSLIQEPSTRCFTAEINLQISSATNPPYQLVGYLDLLFEGEAGL